MVHTSVCHDWLEGLPPKISFHSDYYYATRVFHGSNFQETLSRTFFWRLPTSSRSHQSGHMQTGSTCAIAQALSAHSVILAVLSLIIMCHLLPITGRMSGDYWWLTEWDSFRSRVSCPVRVRWLIVVCLKWSVGFPDSRPEWSIVRHGGF